MSFLKCLLDDALGRTKKPSRLCSKLVHKDVLRLCPPTSSSPSLQPTSCEIALKLTRIVGPQLRVCLSMCLRGRRLTGALKTVAFTSSCASRSHHPPLTRSFSALFFWHMDSPRPALDACFGLMVDCVILCSA